jgi:hypothetical protein
MLYPTAENINAAGAFKNKITAPNRLWQTDFIYRKKAVVAENRLEGAKHLRKCSSEVDVGGCSMTWMSKTR